MSFGVGQSANSSVKNNLNLFSKRSRLKNTLSTPKAKKVEFKVKSISSVELLKLRRKLSVEYKIILLKQVVVLIVIMFILFLITSHFI